MSKVYSIEHYANDYNQHGSYTIVIFKEKPDFHALKNFFENQDDHEIPCCQGLTYDAVYGKLARGEEVCEFKSGGGDSWYIKEWELR